MAERSDLRVRVYPGAELGDLLERALRDHVWPAAVSILDAGKKGGVAAIVASDVLRSARRALIDVEACRGRPDKREVARQAAARLAACALLIIVTTSGEGGAG